MLRPAATLCAALLASSAPAYAQDGTNVAVSQTNVAAPGGAAAAAVDQIGSRERMVAGSFDRARQPDATSQVTPERETPYADLNPAEATPSAAAPPSPARLADSRNTDAVVPTGPDRCDPRNRLPPVACDRVIEARAGEFRAPDHQPLSAEERLLASQRELRPSSSDLNAATRRLAGGELDESDAGLAVASVALQDRGRPPREEQPADEPSTLDAIVSGITTLILGLPANP